MALNSNEVEGISEQTFRPRLTHVTKIQIGVLVVREEVGDDWAPEELGTKLKVCMEKHIEIHMNGIH